MTTTADELATAIKQRRDAIRHHRDQLGDDRCWLDDYSLYRWLPGAPEEPRKLPDAGEMRRRCTAFFQNRQRSDEPASRGHERARAEWDADLVQHATDTPWLTEELRRLEAALRRHFD